MMHEQTVSLCLIARNEEDCILKCISSVKHLVDEIIVVDTGSEDATPQLAAQAGAKVFHYNWNDNFAQARDYGLELASSDWILVLDCDEVLEEISREDFLKLLSKEEVAGYFLQVRNYLGEGQEEAWDQIVRLFRNNPAYRFTGAIHEQVAGSILEAGSEKVLAHSSLTINHYGYLNNKLRKKDKCGRNTRIIRKQLEYNPDDPYLLYCLALEHYQREEIDAGVGYLEKAIGLMHGSEGYFKDAALKSALGYLKLGRAKESVDSACRSLEMLPEDPDLFLCRGNGLLLLGQYSSAAADFEKSLQLSNCKDALDRRILIPLGDAHNLAGNYRDAGKAYFAALCRSPEQLYPLTQILGMIQKNNIPLECEQLCRFTSIKHKQAIAAALFAAEDIPLGMMITLFSLYQAADDDIFGVLSDELAKTVIAAIPKLTSFVRREGVYEYFAAAGKELYTLLLAIDKGYDLSRLSAKNRLRVIAEELALLIAHEVCPAYLPAYCK